MMKKHNRYGAILLGFLLLNCNQYVMAEQHLADVLVSLARDEIKVARYEEKHVAYYLDEPLISKGTLKFESPDKLTKEMHEPEFVSQQIIGSEVIVTREGNKKEQFSLTSHPGLEGLANFLRSLLSGDIGYLESNYTIEFSDTHQGWILILVPRDDNIKKWIKEIEVNGEGNHIMQFRVTEVNGDFTVTSLYEDSQN